MKDKLNFYWTFGFILVFTLIVFSFNPNSFFTGYVTQNRIGDLSGQWKIVETTDQRKCGEGIEKISYIGDIIQNKNGIKFKTQEFTFAGTLIGNEVQLSINKPFRRKGVSVKVFNANLLINSDCNSAQGTVKWDTNDRGCFGDGTIIFNRINPLGCGLPPKVCKESWTCSTWNNCINGTQTRLCNDNNACGTEKDKPIEGQSCSLPSSLPAPQKKGLSKVLIWLLFSIISLVALILVMKTRKDYEPDLLSDKGIDKVISQSF